MSLCGGPRLLVAAASLGLLAGLAACTPDEPEPTPSASATAEPTETPSPTPTFPPEAIAPERPAAMNEISVAGAEAAATYFLALYPYVYATGDLTEWRALSHPECVFCASVVTNVEEQATAGNASQGGLVAVTRATGTQVGDTYFAVRVAFDQAPSATVDGNGEIVEEFPEAKSYVAEMGVAVVDGRLVIRGAEPEVVESAT